MTLVAGTKLGRYEILSQLGVGGMGEVYLAQDTKLDRKVALKILPDAVASKQERMARFVREAKAAAALNHPNIAHIYEIGEEEGVHLIAMEFVDGQTLRQKIHREHADLGKLLRYLQQVAEGMAKAHAAGIVHRDLKPDNIMISRDGYAKILDFGLAKLVEPTTNTRQQIGGDGLSEVATAVLPQHSIPGTVMGTAGYMSPEQAQGKISEIDHRSDIFSFGCILFEAATKRKAFEGKDTLDSLHNIVHAPTPQIKDLNPVAPAELQRIVRRCLAKDPEKRYQSIKEVSIELDEIRQELQSDSELHDSVHQTASDAGSSPSGHPQGSASAISNPSASMSTQAYSAEYIAIEIKRHKRGALIALVGFAVIIAGVGFGLYKYANRELARPIFQNAQLTRITTSGKAHDANISRDGKYVVYTEDDDDGNSSVLVKQTATGNTLVIVPPAKVSLLGTVFSPDGNFVYYLMNDLSSDITSLYQVPSIGGTPKKIMSDVDSPPAISPDGSRLVFMREDKVIKFKLIVANSDGTGERVVTTRHGLEWFQGDGPAWSPDGKTIACAAGISSSPVDGSIEYSLLGFDAETGRVSELSPKRWMGYAGRVIWLPDGNALALVASESDTDSNQVWRVALPGGAASRITNDVLSRDSRTLGVTADGLTLLTVTKQILTRLELVPADGNTSQVARLTSSEANREGFWGFAWTPDGRIVFASDEGGQSDLWVMNADGTARRRLISDIYWDGDPAISSDGRYIVFSSNRPRGGSVPFLWRMDLDGGNLIQLTRGEDTAPNISPDGRWVIFSSWVPGPRGNTGQGLWKVSIDGGAPVQLTDYNTQTADYSPDGNSIVATVFDDQVTPKRWRNAVIPANGGPPIKQFDRPNYDYQYARWTLDGRHLSYIGQPAVPSNIWLQPIAGGEPRKLTDFKTDMIFRHAWSRDGKTLTVVRGNRTTDVVLMKDTGPGAP